MNTCVKEYKFEAVLGRGMFGTVHLVRRTKDLKPFVIKEQSLSVKTNLSFAMVLREVEYLQKMRHPNIVAYHAAWVENDKSYILMEYATRGTLKELLEKLSEPLMEENALYLFSQITLGVHHIHTKKILHRDLKPENILLTGRKGDIVKITDFGVSKNILEESMCCAGSYCYMAPEMLSYQPYDLKSDIWSMGVILYEMVTKQLPFPASDLAEITKMVCNKKPKPFNKKISISTIRLISKMLTKQAAYRPRTDQLILCPYLVPFIARVYLNLGRVQYNSRCVMVTDGLFLYDCEMSVEHEKHFIVRRMTVKFGHGIKGRRVTTAGSKGRNCGELISFDSTRARERVLQ